MLQKRWISVKCFRFTKFLIQFEKSPSYLSIYTPPIRMLSYVRFSIEPIAKNNTSSFKREEKSDILLKSTKIVCDKDTWSLVNFLRLHIHYANSPTTMPLSKLI